MDRIGEILSQQELRFLIANVIVGHPLIVLVRHYFVIISLSMRWSPYLQILLVRDYTCMTISSWSF